MNVIKRIEIKNFRSINHIIIEGDLNDLNVFVGNNDVGKSNILRAINLFFNGQPEIDKPFDFWEDFNKNIQRTSGKGQYIKVVLDIELKYESNKYVRWTRQWDSKGVLKIDDKSVRNSDGSTTEFTPNSRASSWLDNIRFRYVPAIKSAAYFQYLFEELHDLLNETYSHQFQKNTQTLIASIQSITRDISDELNLELSIDNKLALPSDLKKFFGTLDFSLDNPNGQKFRLSGRGDGIKIRHIPIILKFMADKAKLPNRGALHVQTIWGFEEPENNLEMAQAFQVAEYFRKCSDDIQIFLTTHSPAFYSLHSKGKVSCFFVKRDINNHTVAVNTEKDGVDLDKEMGMLSYITPFLEQKNKELLIHQEENTKLRQELSAVPQTAKVVVFTEDSTDDLKLIRNLLLCHNFNLAETQILSYNGKTNFSSALFAAKTLGDKFPKTKYFIFYRDMDCDGEAFKRKYEKRLQSENTKFKLLMPKGYDLESIFVDAKHIQALYPELSEEKIEEIIQAAIDETEGTSIEKITNSVTKDKIAQQREDKLKNTDKKFHPEDINYYKITQEITALYQSDKTRYMYGKKVKSIIEGKIRSITKKKVNIGEPSDAISIPLLKEIHAKVWR